MKGQVQLFSHGRDDWETPQLFFEELNREFNFNWDAAADKINCKVSGECYFSSEENALNKDWFIPELDTNMRIFCNPPYSKWQKFVEKAYYETFTLNNQVSVVMLLPARTDTKAFHKYIYNQPNVEIRFLKGRLKFELGGKPVLDKKGKPQSAPFPSLVAIFR